MKGYFFISFAFNKGFANAFIELPKPLNLKVATNIILNDTRINDVVILYFQEVDENTYRINK